MSNLRYVFLGLLAIQITAFSKFTYSAEGDLTQRFDLAIRADCDLAAVNALIDEAATTGLGVDDIAGPGNKTPLMEAVKRGCIDIIRRLAEAGANLNQAVGQFQITPLHLAVTHRQTDAINRLLNLKDQGYALNLNPVSSLHGTPYEQARAIAPDIAQLLRDRGAKTRRELAELAS